MVLNIRQILATVHMLQHETLIVLDRKAVLLLRVGRVLLELKLKLVDEHLRLFLVVP